MENKKLKKIKLNYLDIRIIECREPLVNLSDYDFVLEPVYFIENGWGEEKMYLREGVAKKLEETQKFLPVGCKFKIFDAFRSIQTQKKIYDDYKNKLKIKHPELRGEELEKAVQEFVVLPKLTKEAPPRHNTGGAVDLTIVDEKGKELDMGTSFDHFGEEASLEYFFQFDNYQGMTTENLEKIKENRKSLNLLMSRAGFSVYQNEWWHWEMGTQFRAFSCDLKYAKYGSADLLD